LIDNSRLYWRNKKEIMDPVEQGRIPVPAGEDSEQLFIETPVTAKYIIQLVSPDQVTRRIPDWHGPIEIDPVD
jgi:hypothetical protein